MANDKLYLKNTRETTKYYRGIEGLKKLGKDLKYYVNKIETDVETKVNRIAKYRADARRKVSLANKRIRRLEQKGLTDTPAYQGYIKDGGKPFSVRGKNYQELQAEVGRMDRLIQAQTSTVRGTNKYLKNMAKQTGIKYRNLNELRKKAPKFFELANKIEQYNRTIKDMASSIGYQQIWESINEYTQSQNIDLANTERSIDDMISDVTKAMGEYKKPIKVMGDWFELK